MALRSAGTWVWTGATDTVYTKDTNWTLNGGAAAANDYPGWDNDEGGGTNVDGDTVILTGTVTNGCSTAAAFDAGGKGKLAKFIVTDTYNGAVGQNAANPLQIAMGTTGEVFIEGTKALDIFLDGDATSYLGLVTVMDLQPGKVFTLGGKSGTLNLSKGQVTTAASATIADAINVGYISNQESDSTLILTAGTTVPASINCQGGTITNNVNFTTVTVGGAKFTNAAGDVDNIAQYGGQFLWNAGTLANTGAVHVYAGKFNATGGTVARTCTHLYQYGTATVDLNDGRRWVTVSNWHLMCASPKLSTVPGQVISITGA